MIIILDNYYLISTSMIKPASQDVRGAEGSEPAAWSLAASGRPVRSAEQRTPSNVRNDGRNGEKRHFEMEQMALLCGLTMVLCDFTMVFLWFSMFFRFLL